MLVQKKHLEWNFEKREQQRPEIEEAVKNGTMDRSEADFLLSSDQYAPFLDEAADCCFVCGEKLSLPCVMWHGHSESEKQPKEIWMHPACAERIAHALIRDVDETLIGKELANSVYKAWKIKNNTKSK